MSNPRAIITLQCGHYSNYIGTHFWNIQESSFEYKGQPEICPDVLFREGLTPKKDVTFTPRLVAIDLKGSLGLLPKFGDLYEEPVVPKSESLLWSGNTEIRKEERQSKNDFQLELEAEEERPHDEDKDVCATDEPPVAKVYDLSKQVSVWSDFLRTRYHPKTNMILSEYQHENTVQPFDVFGVGSTAWKENDGDEIEDRIRFFSEEADSLDGFHLFVDSHDSFAGLASPLVDFLADDYPNKSVLSFPCLPSAFREYTAIANTSRLLNTAMCLRSQLPSSLAVTPISLAKDTFTLPGNYRHIDGINYNHESSYHSAAILAAAVDSLTLPWRTRSGLSIRDLPSELAAGGRKVLSLASAFPFHIEEQSFLVNHLPTQPLVSLTPSCDDVEHNIRAQAVTLRGFGPIDLKHPTFGQTQQTSGHPFANCSTIADVMAVHLRQRFPSTVSGTAIVKKPLFTAKPYPQFFDPRFNPVGRKSKVVPSHAPTVNSIPQMTLWQSSKGSANVVKTLYNRTARLNLHKLHRFEEAGLEEDELKELVEELGTCSDCYDETDAA